MLPVRFEYVVCNSATEVAEGIPSMVVRVAPAIGCAIRCRLLYLSGILSTPIENNFILNPATSERKIQGEVICFSISSFFLSLLVVINFILNIINILV